MSRWKSFVHGALGVLAAASVGEPPVTSRERLPVRAGLAQVQRHPVEELLVVRNVPRPQLRVAERGGAVGDGPGLRFRIGPRPAGSDPDQERDGVSPGDLDSAIRDQGRPAVEHGADAYLDVNACLAVTVQGLLIG
jgi:hypothetical protein